MEKVPRGVVRKWLIENIDNKKIRLKRERITTDIIVTLYEKYGTKQYRDSENLHFNNMFVNNVKYLIRYIQDKQHNLKNDWQETKSTTTIVSKYDYIDYVTDYTGDLKYIEAKKQHIHNLTDKEYIDKEYTQLWKEEQILLGLEANEYKSRKSPFLALGWLLLALLILRLNVIGGMLYIGFTLILFKIYEKTYLSRNIQNPKYYR